MLSLLVATALAQQPLTVPLGRAAVLAPQQAPTELTIDKPSIIDVQPVMPWLIVVGKSVGKTDLRMAHAEGTLTWAVTVSADATAPTGALLLDQPTRQVAVAVDDGWLLPWPDDGTALTVVKPDKVSAKPFGERWVWVQGEASGVSDVIIERGSEPPQITTVTVGRTGPAPEQAHPIGPPIQIPHGGTTLLDAPTRPEGWLVGRGARVAVEEAASPPGALRLRGTRAGSTWMVTSYADGHVEVRQVVVSEP